MSWKTNWKRKFKKSDCESHKHEKSGNAEQATVAVITVAKLIGAKDILKNIQAGASHSAQGHSAESEITFSSHSMKDTAYTDRRLNFAKHHEQQSD